MRAARGPQSRNSLSNADAPRAGGGQAPGRVKTPRQRLLRSGGRGAHDSDDTDAGEEERFNREAVREYNETLARTREEEDDHSMCGDEEDEETADANARASPLEHNRVKVKPRAKPKRNAKGKRKKRVFRGVVRRHATNQTGCDVFRHYC